MPITLGKPRTTVGCITEVHPFHAVSAGFDDDGALGALDVDVRVVFDDGSQDVVRLNLMEALSAAQATALRAAWKRLEAVAHARVHGS